MQKEIIKTITEKYNSFSKTNKIIADYILKNYYYVSFFTIKELSEKINVSPASITRFAKAIGLEGYPMLQSKLQEIVKTKITPMREIRESITFMEEEKNILEDIFKANIKSLEFSLTNELLNSFFYAVDCILGSRKIYILGLRSSYSVAHYLYFMLMQFMDNVNLLNTNSWDIYDRLAGTSEKDVLIAISYAKYTALTQDIVKFCKTKGVKIIAITDSISSPIAIDSDIPLIGKNASNAYSFVCAMSICNALVVACGGKDKDESIAKMKQKEQVLIKNNIYR